MVDMEIKSVDFFRYNDDTYTVYVNIGVGYFPFFSPIMCLQDVTVKIRQETIDKMLEIDLYKNGECIATMRLPKELCYFMDIEQYKKEAREEFGDF